MFRVKNPGTEHVILGAYKKLQAETKGIFSPHGTLRTMCESVIGMSSDLLFDQAELLDDNKGLSTLTPYEDVLQVIPKSAAFLLTRAQSPPLPRAKSPGTESDVADSDSDSKGKQGKKVQDFWVGISIEDQWDLMASFLVEPFLLAFLTNVCLDVALDSIHVFI